MSSQNQPITTPSENLATAPIDNPETSSIEPRQTRSPLTSFGQLQVRVYLSDQAAPLAGATVIISSKESPNQDTDAPTGEPDLRDTLHYSLVTDKNGLTPKVNLPTPAKTLSEKPGSIPPYSVYDVMIKYPGFYSVLSENIQIFPDTVSILPVQLVPLPFNQNLQSSQTDEQIYSVPSHILNAENALPSSVNSERPQPVNTARNIIPTDIQRITGEVQ